MMDKTITTEEACTHEPLVDTGVGYYHCPACNQGWSYQEWELKNSKPNLMNKTIEERAKELYPNCDPADKLYSALIEDLRAAYIAGATENISGSTSTSTQVTTVCAKELRGEAGCKELCDECKRKMQEELKEFDSYLTETRNSFVKAITEVYPHEERLDDYARSTIRVAAEDILIAFDQLRDRFAAVSTEAEGWRRVEDEAVEFAKFLRTAEWQDGELKTLFRKGDYKRLFYLYKNPAEIKCKKKSIDKKEGWD